MHKITIIGTEPPCPRCGLLTQTIKAKIDELNIPAWQCTTIGDA